MSDELKPKKTVLIAEDDAVSRHLLRSFLIKSGYQVITVADGVEALTILQSEGAPHLAVLDWMMPGMEGPEVCKRIRQFTDRTYTYVLLLTARTQKGDLLVGLDAGADDYLTKPFDALELRARLHVGQRILELQDTLIRTREALRTQATHDSLTGIYNRAAVLAALHREHSRHVRDHGSFAIIMADIDHFKRVNDSYGHLAGDEVLKQVTYRMMECVRSYDTVGRYGGEEFLIVAPNLNTAHALGLAERVRQAIQATTILTAASSVPVTASLGIVVSDGHAAIDIQTLLTLADEALYRAKALGRNRSELASTMESDSRSSPAQSEPARVEKD